MGEAIIGHNGSSMSSGFSTDIPFPLSNEALIYVNCVIMQEPIESIGRLNKLQSIIILDHHFCCSYDTQVQRFFGIFIAYE